MALLDGIGQIAFAAVIHGRFQDRDVVVDFSRPVAEDRRGADDQKGIASSLLFIQGKKEGHDLMGLAQPHLIAEQPSEPVFIQEADPLKPQPLVGP